MRYIPRDITDKNYIALKAKQMVARELNTETATFSNLNEVSKKAIERILISLIPKLKLECAKLLKK